MTPESKPLKCRFCQAPLTAIAASGRHAFFDCGSSSYLNENLLPTDSTQSFACLRRVHNKVLEEYETYRRSHIALLQLRQRMQEAINDNVRSTDEV